MRFPKKQKMTINNYFYVMIFSFIGASVLTIFKINFHWKYLKHQDSNLRDYHSYIEYRFKSFSKSDGVWFPIITEFPFFSSIHSKMDDIKILKLANKIKLMIILIWLLVVLFIYSMSKMIEMSF